LIFILLGIVCLITIKKWPFFNIGLWIISIIGGFATSYLLTTFK
jgi:hypothetical protein